jgi:peptide/nickel transport system permease protein
LIKSVVKNIVHVVLLVFLGSYIVFFISKKLPYDTVDKALAYRGIDATEMNYYDTEYARLYKIWNLHKPLFYFSIEPSHHYPQLNSVVDKKVRADIASKQDSVVAKKFFYPRFYYHGADNQYHHFITDLMKGQPGSSIIDGRPILSKIWNALAWSICIMLVSLLIAIMIAMIIVYCITRYSLDSLKKMMLRFSVFSQAFPVFIFATLVLIFLTNDQLGFALFNMPLNISVDEGNLFSIFVDGFSKYAPAVFCIVLFDVLYLIRLLLINIDVEKIRPYIEVLKTRNVSMDAIIRHHLFPNVMVPFTTLIIGSIPSALAGTLLLEVIFNIPGMGRLIYESINGQDWGIVYTIVILFIVISIVIFKFNDAIIGYFDKRTSS